MVQPDSGRERDEYAKRLLALLHSQNDYDRTNGEVGVTLAGNFCCFDKCLVVVVGAGSPSVRKRRNRRGRYWISKNCSKRIFGGFKIHSKARSEANLFKHSGKSSFVSSTRGIIGFSVFL